MRLLLSLLLFLCSACITSFAQKNIKDIRAALKAKRPADALKIIEKQRRDTASPCSSKYYYLGVEAALQQSEKENERIYLQQKPDTAAYFLSLNAIFQYALLTDSAEVSEQKNPKKQPAHRQELNRLLNRLYPNLAMGVQYFVRKNDWDNVRRLSSQTLEARHHPIFSSDHPSNVNQNQLVTNAEQYLYASFASGHYHDAERFAELALQDTSKLSTVLETLALVNAAKKDAQNYRKYLTMGVERFPLHLFFFQSLSEELFRIKDYEGVITLSRQVLKKDSTNAQFYLAAAQAYDALADNEQSIAFSQQALSCDSTMWRAQLYIGRAYCRLAKAVEVPISIRANGYKQAFEKQKGYYQLARPHLEIYRNKAPRETQEWQPLLYEVYLKLNLGKEFEEISHLTPTHKS